MSHAIVNEPFSLVRDHARGTDEWHPTICVERLRLGNHLEVVLGCWGFWFVRDEGAHWYGPFTSREQASNFLQVTSSIARAA